jgi:GAF domain-containing protein
MLHSPLPVPARPGETLRERTLGRLIEHVLTLVPAGGVSFVDVDPMQRGERPVGRFADPELRDALAGRSRLAEAALERERPLLLPRVDAWQAAPDLLADAIESLGAERAGAVWTSFRAASVIACPVRTEIGRPLGVLVLASTDPDRPLDPDDVRAVEVVADLASMALERARLLEEESRRARDELLLKRAAEAVSGSLELGDVYGRVVEHAAELTRGERALLTRVSARSGRLSRVAAVDFPDSPGGSPRALDGGLRQVARTRRPVLCPPADDAALGMGSLMHAPIELGPRLYGVLSVAHEQSGRFGEDDLDLLVRLARSSAAAIANALDFERERRIARALTLGFVPAALPELPEYETGLLYAPALGESTGGDIYGAWRLPGGEIAVLVGDVAGKGVETAALSAMVRFFLEARSWDSQSPGLVLEQANSMLMNRLPADTFVTAFLAVLTPQLVRYANAGHLPPLHVSGSAARGLAGHGLPLGIESSARYGESELRLGEGDVVFAYTDGLTEARRGGEIFGLERLAELVPRLASADGPASLVRAVHEEIGAWADGLADDAVALALRRRP